MPYLLSKERISASLIEQDPIGFLYFSHPSNKGTIQTAEMLVDAQNEEEQAAIWIAAAAKELSGNQYGAAIGRYASLFESAAWEFLAPWYYLWHHAMKHLVPDIMIPESVWENIICEVVDPGSDSNEHHAVKNTWRVLRYTSLKDGNFPSTCCFGANARGYSP